MSAPTEIQQTYRYTLPPGITTNVRVATLPNASCALRANVPGAPAPFLAQATPDGFLDLSIRPPDQQPSQAQEIQAAVTIHATAGGQTADHVLELRSAREPTQQMPFPPAVAPRPAAQAPIQPVLSPDEAVSLSDEELLQRGYPIRPDPGMAPSAFNTWRRVVSAPILLVKPRTIPRPDITHAVRASTAGSPQSSSNWSGFELHGGGQTYDWVTGTWTVPNVTGEANKITYSSFWIGLDGAGTPDLVQAGTQQQNVTISFLGLSWSFSTYYAWTQFLPQQQFEQQITNFPVHPGDQIICQVWVANTGQMPALNGSNGVFLLINETTSVSTGYMYTARGSTTVAGAAAEWVMERPTVNGSLPDLADYGMAQLTDAVARTVAGGYISYQGAANEQITMSNGADVLSAVSAVNSATMQFKWHAFH